MDPTVQQFLDKQAEKASAKSAMLEALGRAKLAESQGRDASDDWQVVGEQGISGIEGECVAAMQQLADDYVAAHPDLYTFFETFVKPDASAEEQEQAHDALVSMAGRFKAGGDLESYAVAAMFELARFPRKSIGTTAKIDYRVVSGKGG